ncbi:hypothetical protein WJX73_004558 [Symbiochloris irregularis]|uniref:tRNA(Ile)-lysidine synthetase n=1 Tax=Symbiochloris irregularis TaxID=706552 RepID=A0AAW1PLB1_9CHLO
MAAFGVGPTTRLAVAVSGGADSLALADLARKWSEKARRADEPQSRSSRSSHTDFSDGFESRHHAGDSVEQFFIRVSRGSGLEGLAGIPSSRVLADGLKTIRPLLTATKNELSHHCTTQGITWVDDPTNANLSFARNHIRHLLKAAARNTLEDDVQSIVAACAAATSTMQSQVKPSSTVP